jgi:hypothetical protein
MLISLASAKMSSWQRFSGLGLQAQGRLTRLMLLHRLAMEAELQGLRSRAEFFWREFERKLTRALLIRDLSQTFSADFGGPEPAARMGIQDFCEHLINEVFIDTQCAFFNGYSEQDQNPKPDAREFYHLDRLWSLLDVLDVEDDLKLQLLGDAAEYRIQVCCNAEKWDEANSGATDLLRRFPKNLKFQELRASLEFARATAGLKQVESEEANRSDAKRLEEPIQALEQMCKQFPSTARPYELAGRLHRIRAVKLANGGKPADSLLAIEKAAAYDPSIDTLDDDRAKVGSLMKELQQRMSEVLKAVASRPNTSLNYEGAQLKRQAEAGFAPSLTYRQSKEAQDLTAKSQSAQLRTIWRRIGLAEPAEDVWDVQAKLLIEATNEAMSQRPEDSVSLDRAWSSIAEHDPRVAALDTERITGFLKERFLSQNDSKPQTSTDVPRFSVSEAPRNAGIPFGFWVFSSRDIRLKVQCVLACALLLLAGALALRNKIDFRQRESAWQQIQEAASRGDDFAVVEGSESFLDSSPSRSDPRTQQVESLYKSSLFRWFSRLPGQPDSSALAHVYHFRRLFGTGGSI